MTELMFYIKQLHINRRDSKQTVEKSYITNYFVGLTKNGWRLGNQANPAQVPMIMNCWGHVNFTRKELQWFYLLLSLSLGITSMDSLLFWQKWKGNKFLSSLLLYPRWLLFVYTCIPKLDLPHVPISFPLSKRKSVSPSLKPQNYGYQGKQNT